MKKALSMLLVFSMVLALVIPSFSADPVITAKYDKNNKTVTITVGDVTKSFTGITNNTTQTYNVNGWDVNVTAKNDVATINSKKAAAPAAPAEPPSGGAGGTGGGSGGTGGSGTGGNGNSGTTNNYIGGVGVKVDKNNANFHCNTFGGNGRVWPAEAVDANGKITKHDFKKSPFTFVFNQVAGTTKWKLDDVLDGTTSVGLPVCPECGSDQWVSFSNNSGSPDGKNIQLQHPTVDISIVKVWLDAEGNVIKDPKGLSAKFAFYYEIFSGLAKKNSGVKNTGPATFSVPAGNYTVEELLNQLTDHYELIDVKGAGFSIAGNKAAITITPAMALNGGKYAVTYTNKEDPYAIIEKDWADENPDGLTALFDIYEYDEDADGAPVRGALVISDLQAGQKAYVDPGKYIVGEQAIDGYYEQPDQTIEVAAYKVGRCAFVNIPIVPPPCELIFEKKVDGVNIVEWLAGEGYGDEEIADILAGLLFYLDGDEDSYGPETPDPATGFVAFKEINAGTYTLTEVVDGAAVGIFKAMEPITGIVVTPAGASFSVLGGSVHYGSGGGGGFDFDALYELAKTGDILTIGDPRLNAGGNVQKLNMRAIDEEAENEWLVSFCANGGSVMLGVYPYKAANELADPDALAAAEAALNYIYNKYGSLDIDGGWGNGDNWDGPDGFNAAVAAYLDGDEGAYIALMGKQTRLLSQIAIWYFFNGVGDDILYYSVYPSEGGSVPDQYKIAIDDLFANGLSGEGDIKLAYMVDAEYGLDREDIAQPQLIPYIGGGGLWVENEPADEPRGSLMFEKKVEDKKVVDWLREKGLKFHQIRKILDGLEFFLVNADDASIAYGPVRPDWTGVVRFYDIIPGTYTLYEDVTGAAIGLFKKMDDAEVTIAAGENSFFVLGGTVKGYVDGADIKADDLFKLSGNTGAFNWGYDGSGIGYPGLNSTGHIFYIGVENVRTGATFDSYCANGGSESFSADFYRISHSMKEKDWIMAFNYIEDNYGDLNENRVITQVVTWALLGAVDVGSQDFEDTKLTGAEKDAIKDVMANYGGYAGLGKIVDVLFMEGCDTPYDESGSPVYRDHQPQIVPIYGRFYVENKPVDHPNGKVEFNKTKYGGAFGVRDGEFAFVLFSIGEGGAEEQIGVYYTEGGVVTAEDLAPGAYVFREAVCADLDCDTMATDVGYRPVWKPIYPNGDDGLYFVIPETGAVVWPDGYEFDEDGRPTVDNVYYCKHNALWTVNKETEDSIEYADGWIRFDEGHDAVYEATYHEANCYDGAGWLLICPLCGPTSGGFYIIDEAHPATGHDYFYEPVHPMWCDEDTAGTLYRFCHDCSFSDQIFDYELWYALLLEAGTDPASFGFPPPDKESQDGEERTIL